MPIENLIQTIAWITTQASLVAIGLFALSYAIGSLLKGAPVPFKDIKQFGSGLMNDAIRAAMELALWTSISSLISWIAVVISSAA